MGESWGGALAMIRADLRRRLTLEGKPITFARALRLLLRPGVVCVVAYRINTVLHATGHRLLAKLIEDLQFVYTGMELHLGSSIGPGLVLNDHRGIGIPRFAIIGANCTILGPASLTLGAVDKVDLDRDHIVLGDHCVVGGGVRILGAVTLADGTQIKPNSVVVVSSPIPGSILIGVPARRRGTVPLALVAGWNPLRPVSLPRETVNIPVLDIVPS